MLAMKKRFVFVVSGLLLSVGGSCASIRGGSPPPSSFSFAFVGGQERVLHMDDFEPLSCNKDLYTASCENWTNKFGTKAVHTDRKIVECGECIVMNFNGPELTLLGGIDIRGRLLFRHGYELTLTTTLVAIQGDLSMHSRKPIDGKPAIKLIMIGDDDQYFEPIGENSFKCGNAGTCNSGKKAIAVAGGRISVMGLPDREMPTWVKLYDVRGVANTDGADLVLYEPPPVGDGCSGNGVYYSLRLSEGNEQRDQLSGTPGSKLLWTGTALKVFDRTSTFDGAQLDLKGFRHCLSSTRTYLLTARLRLSVNEANPGSLTGCALLGEHCIFVQFEKQDQGIVRSRQLLWKESQLLLTKYDSIFTIATEISFSSADIDESNTYQVIKLVGAGPGVDIVIEDFNLYLPPRDSFPPPGSECDYLSPVTSDAEDTGLSPFPFYPTHPWVYTTIEDDPGMTGNHFFAVRGRRQRIMERAGLAWDVSRSCLAKSPYLRFRADIRLPYDSLDDRVRLLPIFLATFESGASRTEVLADCSLVRDSKWTNCEGTLVVPAEFVAPTVRSLQVILGAKAGVDYDVDNISLQAEGTNPNTLIVDKSVIGSWAPGAEILITSHTTSWDGHQIRRIENISIHNDFAEIKLNSSIARPTTLLDSRDFAVEVALLSRNIVFESGPDSNPLHGGHFWILHTPLVPQIIEGLEVRHFGQQGTLGRYPIHFHLSGDHRRSRIFKCSVRDSHQRGIVVHGTNNLRVESNIVFQAKGHSIIIEDGIEVGNLFLKNLVAATGAVDIVIPDDGLNGQESDALPSSFWISNPSNKWIGNVAAGSQSSGYWLELRVRGPRAHLFTGDVRAAPLGAFEDNVAHSNGDRGFRTYPRGYIPDEGKANLIGFKSYKNAKKGIFFHQTDNIAIIDGLFADNPIALDFDKADIISVRNTRIIGETELYRGIVESQGAKSVCWQDNALVGMEIHTFTRRALNNGSRGATVQNITFIGFRERACSHVAHVRLDDEKRHGTFDWFTTFEDVRVSDKAKFDFCTADVVGVTDVYLIDRDGSFADVDQAPKTIISNSNNMMAFLGTSNCDEDQGGCNAYCDACFRTVRYDTDPSRTDKYLLQVCEEPANYPCIYINGYVDPDSDQYSSTNYRVFHAQLPRGNYKAVFLSEASGMEVWPTFAMETYKDPLCAGGFDNGAVHLRKPSINQGECNSLIRNGSAESIEGWLHFLGGVALVQGAGIGGSKALSDNSNTKTNRDAIVQYLDTRCFDLRKGRDYEVQAWVKLVDKDGKTYDCHRDNRGCPEIWFVTPGMTKTAVATFVPQLTQSEYQLLHGVLNVDRNFSSSENVAFVVLRNRNDYSMLVDDAAMTILPYYLPNNAECSGQNLVQNGDFSSGSAIFWSRSKSKMSVEMAGKGFRLSLSGGGFAEVFLKAGCFQEGERYEITIEYKINNNGQGIACDPASSSGFYKCPSARLMPFREGNFLGGLRVAEALRADDTTKWALLHGFFTATSDHSDADIFLLRLEDMDRRHVYVLDSVSIDQAESKCDVNMIANGDFEMGIVSYWSPLASGLVSSYSPGFDGSSFAMIASGRDLSSYGPMFNTDEFLDARCLVPRGQLEIRAKMKLLDAVTGTGAACSIGSENSNIDACPAVKVEIRDANGTRVMNKYPRNYVTTSWNPSDWNEFWATISLPSTTAWDGSISKVVIQIRNFPTKWDLVVDNFVVRTVQ